MVIHVNKLKEGWDVRNLYTIVPLRASASDILTEQTLGRVFGFHMGYVQASRLSIRLPSLRTTALTKSSRPPVIRTPSLPSGKLVTVGADGDVSARWRYGSGEPLARGNRADWAQRPVSAKPRKPTYMFETQEERTAADFALRLIQDRYERELKKGIQQLNEPEVKARITADVKRCMAPSASGT